MASTQVLEGPNAHKRVALAHKVLPLLAGLGVDRLVCEAADDAVFVVLKRRHLKIQHCVRVGVQGRARAPFVSVCVWLG